MVQPPRCQLPFFKRLHKTRPYRYSTGTATRQDHPAKFIIILSGFF